MIKNLKGQNDETVDYPFPHLDLIID